MKNNFFKILFLSFITLSMCLPLTDCSKDKRSMPTGSIEDSESESIEDNESEELLEEEYEE